MWVIKINNRFNIYIIVIARLSINMNIIINIISRFMFITSVGGNDTYGVTGIPSTVGGRGFVRRAGLGASTKIVYPGSGREDA